MDWTTGIGKHLRRFLYGLRMVFYAAVPISIGAAIFINFPTFFLSLMLATIVILITYNMGALLLVKKEIDEEFGER